MNPDVIDEVILLPKSGAASLALERPLGQIRRVVARLLVIGERLPVREGIAADVALEKTRIRP